MKFQDWLVKDCVRRVKRMEAIRRNPWSNDWASYTDLRKYFTRLWFSLDVQTQYKAAIELNRAGLFG